MRKRGLVDDAEFVALVHQGALMTERVCVAGRRRDRQPLRRPPRARRRGLGAHPARGARARAERGRHPRVGPVRPAAAASIASTDPAALPEPGLVLVCRKGTDLDAIAARLAGPLRRTRR